MKEFMTDILPWIIIVGTVAAPTLVNILEKAKGNEKRKHRFINGLCIAFGMAAFMFIVLKWDLWICIGCGVLLGVGGFHFGSNSSSSKND